MLTSGAVEHRVPVVGHKVLVADHTAPVAGHNKALQVQDGNGSPAAVAACTLVGVEQVLALALLLAQDEDVEPVLPAALSQGQGAELALVAA
ncbi:hypothetical protein BOW15_09590, partial [Solemya velum gill symbiont]